MDLYVQSPPFVSMTTQRNWHCSNRIKTLMNLRVKKIYSPFGTDFQLHCNHPSNEETYLRGEQSSFSQKPYLHWDLKRYDYWLLGYCYKVRGEIYIFLVEVLCISVTYMGCAVCRLYCKFVLGFLTGIIHSVIYVLLNRSSLILATVEEFFQEQSTVLLNFSRATS